MAEGVLEEGSGIRGLRVLNRFQGEKQKQKINKERLRISKTQQHKTRVFDKFARPLRVGVCGVRGHERTHRPSQSTTGTATGMYDTNISHHTST